jgi:hypothetical protein
VAISNFKRVVYCEGLTPELGCETHVKCRQYFRSEDTILRCFQLGDCFFCFPTAICDYLFGDSVYSVEVMKHRMRNRRAIKQGELVMVLEGSGHRSFKLNMPVFACKGFNDHDKIPSRCT